MKKTSTLPLLATLIGATVTHAAPSTEQQLLDKGFDQAWIDGLTAPDSHRSYSGNELKYIGMPIGGLYAGQVYLSGDGRLWHWDVFNKRVTGSGLHGDLYYRRPMIPSERVNVEQGFWFQIDGEQRALNSDGFEDIRFTGTYPTSTIEFSDAGTPIDVSLKAYSPFAPLNDKDSSIPATILSYTFTNSGDETVELRAGGWLENPTHRTAVENGIVTLQTSSVLDGQAIRFYGKLPEESGVTYREDIIFEDFEDDYSNWTVEGEAFGTQPFVHTDRKPWNGVDGHGGTALINTHNTYKGNNSGQADSYTGKITSQPFELNRNYLTYKIGGGRHKGKTGIRLLVDGQNIAEATGKNSVVLQAARFDIRKHQGKQATLEIFDEIAGSWGHISIDDIVLTDDPAAGATDPKVANDAGSFALALLDQPSDTARSQHEGTKGKLVSETITLKAGESTTVSFAIAWYMPNIHNGERALWALKDMKNQRHYYAQFYNDAEDVAADLIKRHDELEAMTDLWVNTWYDSSLPNWFLSRTFFNVSTLATTTSRRFYNPHDENLNNRLYFWEGVYLGDGTCTHVTHYEQALGRIFPQAARDQRRAADYDAGWDDELGYVRYRAEYGYGHHFGIPHASDGHAGVILRTYREHTTNTDNNFLKPIWPRVKRSMQFMIDQDAGRGFFADRVPAEDKNSTPDGFLTGPQYNTLDRTWYGKIPWISGLYQAALLATAEMADDMGDTAFAKTCREIAARGKENMTAELYNSDYGYYVQTGYEGKEAINVNKGSHIDQLLGQYWATQNNLDRVFPEAESTSALAKVFEHNLYKEVGDFQKNALIKFLRVFADPDEPGTLMATFPHKGAKDSIKETGVIGGYFSEVWSGQEYPVAAAMIDHGLVLEGLAVCRAADDRYAGAPLRRNPFNEVEYGNHYSRALSGYAPFVSISGFSFHGPKGEIGFAPKLNPDDFKSAFTAAEGWGSYTQVRKGRTQSQQIELLSGSLTINQLSSELAEGRKARKLSVKLNGKKVKASFTQDGSKVVIALADTAELKTGDTLVWQLK